MDRQPTEAGSTTHGRAHLGRESGNDSHPMGALRRENWFRDLISRSSVLPILIPLWVIFAVTTPAFASLRNAQTLLAATAVIGVAAIGETFVLMTAGIDLSVASVTACSAILSAQYMESTGSSGTVGMLVAIAIGLVFGVFNGVLVAYARLTPFVLTLGTHLIARGIAFTASEGIAIRAPELVRAFGRMKWLGIPAIAVVAILLMVLFGFLLAKTTWGRHVTLVGANRSAAEYVGIRRSRVIASVYILTGGLCGIAGFLSVANLGAAIPGVGDPILLTIIGGVILGGTSMFGGVGSMTKTAFGVLLLAMLINGLNLRGFNFYDQLIAQGVLIVLGTAFTVKFGREQQPA